MGEGKRVGPGDTGVGFKVVGDFVGLDVGITVGISLGEGLGIIDGLGEGT